MQFINLNKNKIEKLVFNTAGQYVVFLHNLSGKFIFELTSAGAEVYIYGLFTGKDADKYKIETIQHHKAPSATSNLLIKGVFADESKFDYSGLIRIEKEGQNSHAYQKNQNLILSPGAFVQSKPYLEILANEVFCTHGSTTGKLNSEQVYYLMTRGLSESESKNLLVEGFITEVIDKVKERIPEFTM
jgi:Fe-S cluster assembly protein SufD